MSETRASSFLQTSSQALVIAAGLVYLFGFIIVSVFDASYGIADFSLFRTKVIAIGTVFVFLLSLPVIGIFRMFGIFGLQAQHADVFPPAVTPKSYSFHVVDVGLSIPFGCVGFAWLLSFLFTPPVGWTARGLGLWLLLGAILATVDLWSHKHFDRRPLVFVFISALASVALFVVLFKYAARSFFWTVVWFTVVCAFTLQIYSSMRKREEIRRTPWERLFLFIVPAIFGLYALKVFPNIKHEFGGGAPVPIILHLSKKLPALDSENPTVSLIDETEQGYYVLSGTDKAVFVARGLVEEVEFLRTKQEGTKKP